MTTNCTDRRIEFETKVKSKALAESLEAVAEAALTAYREGGHRGAVFCQVYIPDDGDLSGKIRIRGEFLPYDWATRVLDVLTEYRKQFPSEDNDS